MNYAVQVFDLSVDRRGDLAEARQQGGSVLQIVALPATAQDVALKVDDGDFVPVTGLLRLEFRAGLFSKLTLRNAPTSGTLSLYAGTEPIPFVSGGAGAGELLPHYEVLWPPYSATAAIGGGSAFATQGSPRLVDGAAVNLWFGKFGTGTNNMRVYKGRLCGQFGSGAGLTVQQNVENLYPALERPMGSKVMPAGIRVWRLEWELARDGLYNWTDETGICLGLVPGLGWIKAGNFGIGLLGDGAGGWRHVSKRVGGVGVYTESVPLTWPAPLTEWVTVDMELRSASSRAEAVYNLYLNKQLALTRLFGPGTKLPDYTLLLNSAGFGGIVRAGDAGIASALCIASLRPQYGRTDIYGLEVT